MSGIYHEGDTIYHDHGDGVIVRITGKIIIDGQTWHTIEPVDELPPYAAPGYPKENTK